MKLNGIDLEKFDDDEMEIFMVNLESKLDQLRLIKGARFISLSKENPENILTEKIGFDGDKTDEIKIE